jgi:hypothetical protein
MRLATIAIVAVLFFPFDASAYTCGHYLRAKYGLPASFGLARNWATLPRTSAHPGAVVVQSRRGRALGGGPGGHVSRIVSMQGRCRAIVNDNAGTYSRDICKNLIAYVSPGGRSWSSWSWAGRRR